MGVAAACEIACVAAWLVSLSVYDVRERRLPNLLTLPGAAMILSVAALNGRGVPAMVGAVCLAGIYLVIHLVSPAGMGAGDVKLAIGMGALTGSFGAGAWFVAAIGAPAFTVLWAAISTRNERGAVPHGPSMCLAALLSVFLTASP